MTPRRRKLPRLLWDSPVPSPLVGITASVIVMACMLIPFVAGDVAGGIAVAAAASVGSLLVLWLFPASIRRFHVWVLPTLACIIASALAGVAGYVLAETRSWRFLMGVACVVVFNILPLLVVPFCAAAVRRAVYGRR